MAFLQVMSIVFSLLITFSLADAVKLRKAKGTGLISRMFSISSQKSDDEMGRSAIEDIISFTLVNLIKQTNSHGEGSLPYTNFGEITKKQRGYTSSDLQEMVNRIVKKAHNTAIKHPTRRTKRFADFVDGYGLINPYIPDDSAPGDTITDTFNSSETDNNTVARNVFADISVPQNETREETFESIQSAIIGKVADNATEEIPAIPADGVIKNKNTWMYQGLLGGFDALGSEARRKRSEEFNEPGEIFQLLVAADSEQEEEIISVQGTDNSTNSASNFTIQQTGSSLEDAKSIVQFGDCKETDQRYCFSAETVCTDLHGNLAEHYACEDEKICCDLTFAP